MNNKTLTKQIEECKSELMWKIRLLSEAERAEVQKEINSYIEKLNKSRISKHKS